MFDVLPIHSGKNGCTNKKHREENLLRNKLTEQPMNASSKLQVFLAVNSVQ